MRSHGRLVVISGFSGAGKGTVVNATLAKYPNFALSISATTRPPREGEVDGREYFFKTREEFEHMIEEDMFVEYAQYVGNYYGTPKGYVQDRLLRGRDVILEIEIQGAMEVKEKFPDSLLIFMTPPSGQELLNRLKGRGTEDEATILNRMKRALEEAEGVAAYDHVLVNDEIGLCADRLNEIVLTSKDDGYSGATESERKAGIELVGRIKEEIKGLI